MTKDVIETAVREGLPFAIRMADGREYVVTEREQVHFGKSHVLVVDAKALPHVLPLLTITGVSYLESAG